MQPAKKKGSAAPKAESVSQRKKRPRAEESGPLAIKASKFRKSSASGLSAAVASGSQPCVREGGPLTVNPNFPVEPNVRAKQMQLFGGRIHQLSSTSEVLSKKKRAPVPQKQNAGKHIQTTLTEAFFVQNATGTEYNTDNKAPDDFTQSSDGIDNKENRIEWSSPGNIRKIASSITHPVVIGQNQQQFNKAKTLMMTPIMPTVTRNIKGTQERSTVTVSTTDTEFVCSTKLHHNEYNSMVMLREDRQLISSKITASSLRYNVASYGQDWVIYHRTREQIFQPWQLALDGKIERLRLSVIQCYWEAMKTQHTTPATVFIATSNLARLLNFWDKSELEHPSLSKLALTSFIAYRLAFKTEERPEILWEVSNFWNLFPIFRDLVMDKSDHNINLAESDALRVLNDLLDVPLAPMFLSQYILAAGWPQDLSAEYHELGLYLISLATFASVKDTLLRNVVPSKLAGGALALAVKISNLDRGYGIVKHLPECSFSSSRADGVSHNADTACICRYEFWPRRLETYADLTFDDIHPVVRGLSSLLRSKPEEARVLKHFFPTWGDHEWQ